jgi:hypothetical protein
MDRNGIEPSANRFSNLKVEKALRQGRRGSIGEKYRKSVVLAASVG